jgi:hypothetical protein
MTIFGDSQAARCAFKLSIEQPIPDDSKLYRKQFGFLGTLHGEQRQEMEQCRLVLYHRVQDASTGSGSQQVRMQSFSLSRTC